MKVARGRRDVHRAIDQHRHMIDVFVSLRRDIQATRRFFVTRLGDHGEPDEVVTGRSWALRPVIDELILAAFHDTTQHPNNRIEADHARLKARLRPMWDLKRDHSAQ